MQVGLGEGDGDAGRVGSTVGVGSGGGRVVGAGAGDEDAVGVGAGVDSVVATGLDDVAEGTGNGEPDGLDEAGAAPSACTGAAVGFWGPAAEVRARKSPVAASSPRATPPAVRTRRDRPVAAWFGPCRVQSSPPRPWPAGPAGPCAADR